MIEVIRIILVILGFHQILFLVYIFQLKEYRWDRIRDYLNTDIEKFFVNQFDLRNWYRPKITLRSGIILGVTTAGMMVWILGMRGIIEAVSVVGFNLLLISMANIASVPLFNKLKNNKIKKATEIMKSFKGVVVGITGSYGKSSTKEILAWVLAKKYKTLATEKNINTAIGVAQTIISELKGDEEIFIVEMGAYIIGEIEAICDIVRPKMGIITGIGDQHLSLFGSLENIKKAKYELIDSLPEDGYGIVAEKDFRLSDADNIKAEEDKVSFDYEGENFEVGLIGTEVIRNVIGVIKIAQRMGMNLKEIKERLKTFKSDFIYPKIYRVGQQIVVIDDSYNASLESFVVIINYVKVWEGWKKILVSPGIIELGKNSEKDHREIDKKLGIFDKVWLTNSKIAKYFESKNLGIETDSNKLIKKLKEGETKKVIVFKGRVPSIIIESIKNEQSI